MGVTAFLQKLEAHFLNQLGDKEVPKYLDVKDGVPGADMMPLHSEVAVFQEPAAPTSFRHLELRDGDPG